LLVHIYVIRPLTQPYVRWSRSGQKLEQDHPELRLEHVGCGN
jgi:hypothetical protein